MDIFLLKGLVHLGIVGLDNLENLGSITRVIQHLRRTLSGTRVHSIMSPVNTTKFVGLYEYNRAGKYVGETKKTWDRVDRLRKKHENKMLKLALKKIHKRQSEQKTRKVDKRKSHTKRTFNRQGGIAMEGEEKTTKLQAEMRRKCPKLYGMIDNFESGKFILNETAEIRKRCPVLSDMIDEHHPNNHECDVTMVTNKPNNEKRNNICCYDIDLY